MAKLTVTFIKDHPAGLKEGSSVETSYQHAVKLAKGGYISKDGLEIPKDEENAAAGSGKASNEPEFITVELTEEDILTEKYGALADDKLPGDVITVPNPKFESAEEPEFLQVRLTRADIKAGLHKEFYDKPARKMQEGDVIQVPNPNFKPVNE